MSSIDSLHPRLFHSKFLHYLFLFTSRHLTLKRMQFSASCFCKRLTICWIYQLDLIPLIWLSNKKMLSSICSSDEEIEITRHSSQLHMIMFCLADSHVIPLNHGYLKCFKSKKPINNYKEWIFFFLELIFEFAYWRDTFARQVLCFSNNIY